MKLKNKKTGEIVERIDLVIREKEVVFNIDEQYNSLAELNEDWEDVEEDEYYYAITSIKADGGITKMKNKHNSMTAFDKSIGNYFDTREEAELAVHKLKAWKRLKDKGFKFIGKTYETDKRFGSTFYKVDGDTYSEDIVDDLDLLFGGEE